METPALRPGSVALLGFTRHYRKRLPPNRWLDGRQALTKLEFICQANHWGGENKACAVFVPVGVDAPFTSYFRMGLEDFPGYPSDILKQEGWPGESFEVAKKEENVVLAVVQARAEFCCFIFCPDTLFGLTDFHIRR
ncbi:MAG: hypothetical protein IT308_03795 [Anaerolineaceae bacterium]|nr:hypothetical protein [Anaerolineaceae bacterium]